MNLIVWLLRPILSRIIQLEYRLMSAITDLTAGVADLRQAVSDEIAAINAKLGAAGSDDPAVVQAVSDLAALASQVRGETSSVSGAAATGTGTAG